MSSKSTYVKRTQGDYSMSLIKTPEQKIMELEAKVNLLEKQKNLLVKEKNPVF